MFSKGFSAFLKRFFGAICLYFIKMCSTKKRELEPLSYSFKPFKYETVIFSSKNVKIPPPRSGHRIAADSSNFYSFGGYNPLIRQEEYAYEDDSYIDTYPLFQELWKFNFASKKWTKFRNRHTLPKELVSNAVILLRNILLVYGGTGSPFGTRSSNQLYICNVQDEESPMVEVKTTGQLPLPLYGQAIVYHSDYLYTVGGTSGFSYTCDIHRLNLKTFTWEVVYICNGTLDNEPPGRYRHELAFDGKRIFILAGGTSEIVFNFAEIPTFDIEKRQWSNIKTIPAPNHGIPMGRRCHGAAQIEQGDSGIQVFIMGGHDGENIFSDLWRLDLKTMQWTCFETCTLPRPMYFHAASITPEGRLYVFGGIYATGNLVKRSNAVYATWVCVPKLSELCWEAVLHYSPRICRYSEDDLINMGLPRNFVQRLGRNKCIEI